METLTGHWWAVRDHMYTIGATGIALLDISGLDNGTYQLTITDANGCWLTSDEITLDADPTFDLVLIPETRCTMPWRF